MEPIITIQQGVLAWLRAQEFEPVLRSIDAANQPVAIYPQASLTLAEESFGPGQADTTARLSLELRCAAGRTRDAQAAAASLAHQVRRALTGSHNLGRLVKQMTVERIAYQRLDGDTGSSIVEQATVTLMLRYVDHEL